MIDYKKYWQDRYITGGNSWKWSYNENAIFKADFINKFIKDNNIETVVEFWCGDWNNLALYNIDNYIGLDISKEAIRMCNEKFKDTNKKFEVTKNKKYKADLTLSLDVTFHILDRQEWEDYINRVIDSADKFTIFYSFPKWSWHVAHINDFNFEEYLKEVCESKGLNYYKDPATPPDSNSRFYIIQKC